MTRGGKREGSGRPVGSGKQGETTKPIRVPISMKDVVRDFTFIGMDIAKGDDVCVKITRFKNGKFKVKRIENEVISSSIDQEDVNNIIKEIEKPAKPDEAMIKAHRQAKKMFR